MMTASNTGKLRADLLIGCTGAVQLLSIGDYVAAIRDSFVGALGVVLTPTAAKLGPVPLIEAIVDEVIGDITTARSHISLSREYQQLIVVPATANFIGGAAQGLARNSVELLTLAMERPSVVVPAMNEAMWRKPAVQRNIRVLTEDGHVVLMPKKTSSVYEAASKSLRFGLGSATPFEVVESLRGTITV